MTRHLSPARNLATLGRFLSVGARVFMGGSTGEVLPVTSAFASGDLPAVDLTTSFVPGINAMPAALADGMRITNPFPVTTNAPVTVSSDSYSAYGKWLARQSFDLSILHVAPPADGRFASLGSAVEFSLIAAQRSKRVVAVINEKIPHLPRAAGIDLDRLDGVIELTSDLACYDAGAPTPAAQEVARNVASFIGDGATIQVGLGKITDALFGLLRDRRGLKLWSGMFSDGLRPLFEAGALDPDFVHTSCVQVGTPAHYDWLNGQEAFAVLGCDITHDAARLRTMPGLVAVNSALEVDLLGRANLEFVGDRRISSVGGAPDFARAAAMAPTGISIVAIPAATPKGASRIVPRLRHSASLGADIIDVVVTEYGAADLRGLDGDLRAEALIAIADPTQADALHEAWRRLRDLGPEAFALDGAPPLTPAERDAEKNAQSDSS